jgi:outer membrane protein OmpA-like peptidoglycan-associated protein
LPHFVASDANNPACIGKRSFIMRLVHRSRLSRIALVASTAMMLAGAAFAQSVQVFDDAISIEQLRSIMTPESQLGASRSIVIQRPDMSAVSPSSVQRAATEVLPAPQMPAAPTNRPSPIVQAAASMPAPSRPSAPNPGRVAEPGTVGFRINFNFDSAALPDSAHSMIDTVAQLMKESPQIKVRVEGHTDASGSADYNVSLSERRALSVGEYMVKQGIEPSRLILIGKGMAEPLTHNRFDPSNRRVQFVRVS